MIEIRTSGPNAPALADAAAAFLREATGREPDRRAVTADRETTRDGMAIGLLGIVLMAPPAIVATLDLIARRRQAERLDRLCAALEALAGTGDHVDLTVGDGPPLDMLATDRDRLMDALSEATGKLG